jgi:transcriptional regulator with XRE-family HTH domain
MVDMHDLGQRLAQARERCGWTQQQLAQRSRIGQNQISRLESGKKSSVEIQTLASLARVLGVTLDYLAGMQAEEDTDDEEHAA